MRALPVLFSVLALLAVPAMAGPPEVAWTTPLDAPSFGSAAVADIDDDGRLEVAFGTYFGDDSVRVLNGEDGSEYWRFHAGRACLDASCRFADLDGDGHLELVVPVSNKGWVLAFDAKSGDELWRYTTSPTECTDSPPAILDLDGNGDGDGKLEVVYGTFKGNL
ncbi:MAG: FG-GAP-like repeat-containing protein, partial [Planctomycetota bacterium]